MPKVSVWLTSYNHEKFIGESIESILEQTYIDYELYIIDDCSTDNSWNIIQQYAQKDARIKAIRHSYNEGGSGLRNMVNELQGEYVAIAHCDDKWLPNKLEKQVEILEKNDNIAACFTLVDVIDDEGKQFTDERHPYCKAFEATNRSRYAWLNRFFYSGNCLCHPSLLIRKKAYTEMGIFTNGLNGLPDFCQWIRLCKKADIYILQERLTKFRVHGDGSNTSGENVESITRLYNEEWLVLREFVDLIDTHEVTKVFPEAEQYVVNGQICEKYALAQTMLNHPRNSYKLFGLQLLYELFQNKEREEEIKELYGYTRKKYNVDKQKYDIFRVIPESRHLQITVYLNGENGYSEDNKISLSAFVQQTGAFSIKVNLKDYPDNMLERIRVDLDEGRYRKFRLCDCNCKQKKVEYRPVNGIHKDEWDVFYTMDPQYELKIKGAGILYISGYTEELLCGEVEQYYNEISRQHNEMKKRCSLLEEEIQSMKNTKLWRARTNIAHLLGK